MGKRGLTNKMQQKAVSDGYTVSEVAAVGSANLKSYSYKHGNNGRQALPTDAATEVLLRAILETARIQDYPGAGEDRVA